MSNNPLYNQLLERVLSEQPELAQFAELFMQQSEETTSSTDTQEIKIRYRKVTNIAKKLRGDLDMALDSLDDLAQALGACECWGENHRCPACKGNGQSGYFKPDRELFERLIKPALDKVTWLDVTEK